MMRGFTDKTKFSQDLSFMDEEACKKLRARDRKNQKEREDRKRWLREQKENWQ